MVAQFLMLPILARYLDPSEFGTVALAMAFVTLSMMLSDAGIGASLVRTKKHDPVVWSSAFWLILGIGTSFSFLLVLLAPWLAIWFEDPEVTNLMYGLAIIPLLQSSLAVPLAHLQKEGQMGLLSSAEVFATLVSFVVAVMVAVNGGGAWALVIQQLVLWILKVSIIGYKTDLSIQRVFSLGVLGEHLQFGKEVMGVAMVELVKTQAHTVMISKTMGAAPLGLFTMAYRFIQLPVQVVTGPVGYVLYGHMAKHKENKTAVRSVLLASTRLLAIVVIPPIAMVATAADPFFTLLLSEKWLAVGNLYAYMAPASALMAITFLSQTVLFTMGETKLLLRLAIEMTVYWVILLFISSQWGLEAVAIAFSFWFLSYLPRLLPAFLGSVNCSVSRYVKAYAVPVIFSLFTVLLHRMVFANVESSALLELGVMVLEIVAVWGMSVLVDRVAIKRAIMQMKILMK